MDHSTKTKRTLEDIEAYEDPRAVYNIMMKAGPSDELAALMATLYVTGGRISEVLRVQHDQFKISADHDFLMLSNMKLSKPRKARRRMPYRDVPMPTKGKLSMFTALIADYLYGDENAPREGPIYRMSRVHAWRQVYKFTGYWPHWFRSMSMSYYGRLFKDAGMLADFFATDVKSAQPYVRRDWQEYTKELLL